MSVLKIYKNGIWESVSGMSEHTHTKNDITDLQEKVYTQPDEPVDAPIGAVWVDTDEDVGFGGSSGGSASIDVTASVGQTIVVEEVDANGKPTKWKAVDLQERTHWKEEAVVLPETTLMVEEGVAFSELDDIYVAGKEYKVTFNGEEYVCTAVDIGGVAAIGNVDILMDTGDNGMPFASLWEEGLGFLVFDGSTSITVSVTEVNYIPIPVEYMPIKPYYYEVNRADLSNHSDGMYTADLAEIPMALLKASCEKMPIYLKVNYLWSNTTESVELPAVFVFPGLDALMTSGYFDAYDGIVPSSEVSGFIPTLYARGLDGNRDIYDYYIRFVDGS